MRRPNILIFMTDQQRGATVLPGDPYKAKTPHLDRFREAAVTFSRAYCPSPHCCPSRATFHTGLYPTEHGVWHNVNVLNAITRGLRDGVRLWSEDFAAAGYRLDFSGKWHLSNDESPQDRGWQEHFPTGTGVDLSSRETWAYPLRWQGFKAMAETPDTTPQERAPGEILRPGWGRYVHYGVNTNGNPGNDRKIVDAALEAMRDRPQDGTPWVQFVGTNGPHDPYFPPQEFLDLYADEEIPLPPTFDDEMFDKPGFYRRTRRIFGQLSREEHREAIRHYLAFCSYEDALFGEVLAALDARGERDNTIVIYLSDHGDYLGDHGLWCKGLPSFNSAYHIPAIVQWPQGQVEAGRTCDAMVSLADFAPTLLEMAGLEVDRAFTGQSLVPWLRHETPTDWRDALFMQSNGNELYGIQRQVLTDRWKYVYNGFDDDELYDLETDPDQLVNLVPGGKHDDVVRELMRRIWRFGSAHGEDAMCNYIMTAFAPVGPAEAFR